MPAPRSTPARVPRRASPTITRPATRSAVAPKPARSTVVATASRIPDTVVVFDTETTGLRRGARLVEIAAIKFVNGREVDRLVSLVDPGERIPYDATAVHGITTAMVRGKLLAAAVYQTLQERITVPAARSLTTATSSKTTMRSRRSAR